MAENRAVSSAHAGATGEDDEVERVVVELRDALAEDFGTARLPAGGWKVTAVEPRTFRRRVPVVTLEQPERRLCFIVTPTSPREPAFKRTPRHDITYFSEDVPDDDQDDIYRRDREMIEAFARWLMQRDAAVRSAR
jgi:hypothetical protein